MIPSTMSERTSAPSPHIPEQTSATRCELIDSLLDSGARNWPHSRIYFLAAPELNQVKIGYSARLQSRLRQLRTQSATRLVLLSTIPGTVRDERALHLRFGHLRQEGEYFTLDTDLAAFIEEHGDAEVLSVKQAAAILGRDPVNIRRYCQDGPLRARKVRDERGREVWRISPVSVQDLLDSIQLSQQTKPGPGLSPHSSPEFVKSLVQDAAAAVAADIAVAWEPLKASIQTFAHQQKALEAGTAAHTEILTAVNDYLAQQPQVYDLIGQLAAARRDLAARDREIARLEEELAAERRTTWWQRLISAVWRGRSPDRPTY